MSKKFVWYFIVVEIIILLGLFWYNRDDGVIETHIGQTTQLDSALWVSRSQYIELEESKKMAEKELGRKIELKDNSIVVLTKTVAKLKEHPDVVFVDKFSPLDTNWTNGAQFGKFFVQVDTDTRNEEIKTNISLKQTEPLKFDVITTIDTETNTGKTFIKSDDLDSTTIESSFALPEKHFYDVLLDYPMESTITALILFGVGVIVGIP